MLAEGEEFSSIKYCVSIDIVKSETAIKIVFPKQVLVIQKEFSFAVEKKEKIINSGCQQSVIFQMAPKGKLKIMCKQFHLRSQRLYLKKIFSFNSFPDCRKSDEQIGIW